ncbi:SRPBCC family protein [Bradyrhizobium sp.]|uniref:SRPBCC family protein n=1 Tax=Bradyrhizobium sp. TaxID=376 RepID=UPI003C5BAE20
MSKPEFVYTTYIETSLEKLWQALTDGDFTERYWFGHRVRSDWTVGSPYQFAKQGAPTIEGKVLEADPPRRLAYSWDSCSPAEKRERTSRVTFQLEPHGKIVKLTVTHDDLDEGGVTLRNISVGWPMVMASLKSLLETGRPIDIDPRSAVEREAACG